MSESAVSSNRPAVHQTVRNWNMRHLDNSGSVETVDINTGVSLILSNMNNVSAPFRYTEPEDIFAIGFHLKGGAHFTMPQGNF